MSTISLTFIVDGATVAEWSGEEDSHCRVYYFRRPSYFRVDLRKGLIISDGEDAAWVDDIVLPPFCFIDAQITSSDSDGFMPRRISDFKHIKQLLTQFGRTTRQLQA